MLRWICTVGAMVAAGCGTPVDMPRCGADQECGAGLVCEKAAADQGVCVVPFRIAITAPAANGWVGRASPVAATMQVLSPGRALPPTVDLAANGATVATLSRVGTTGGYEGTWSPAAGTAASVVLTAIAGRGTQGETASAPVSVRVDLDPPVLTGVTADCDQGCRRDGVLTVRATLSELNPSSVTARLDLDPTRTVTLNGSGGQYTAAVDLGSYPFPYFERTVQVAVSARDAAGNTSAVQPANPKVSRLRWTYAAEGTAVTSPGVLVDGSVVAGVSATTNQLVALAAETLQVSGEVRWRLTVGSGAITAAPSIGPTAIWVGSQDGRVYAVKHDGSAILNGSGCNTSGAVQGAPALSGATPETAFAGSSAGRLYAVDAVALCAAGPLTDTFSSAPAVDGAGKILAATATATLRKYSFDGAALVQDWNAQVGVNVAAPVAVDAADGVWTGSQDAKLNRTTSSGSTSTVKTLGGSIIDSPVILAGGDVVVGDQAKVLHRYRPDGTQIWLDEPVLDGPALAPLVLAGGDAAFLVPTRAGTLHAVSSDGKVIWSAALGQGALTEGNMYAVPGAATSIAFFGSAEGKLYAVTVDGHLDAAAPWPKAHHDIRNTGNAASPLP